MQITTEEQFWQHASIEDLSIVNKLIVARKLDYVCGPVGTDVPKPGRYIVRPIINPLGLGLGASIETIDKSTDHLTPGYFWCEIFEGRHLSVDYFQRKQILAVEGFRNADSLTKWNKWVQVDDQIELPPITHKISRKYDYINCEFINNRLIEIHLRPNPDFFQKPYSEYIPVWEGQDTTPPKGYHYIEDKELHGRIGAFIR